MYNKYSTERFFRTKQIDGEKIRTIKFEMFDQADWLVKAMWCGKKSKTYKCRQVMPCKENLDCLNVTVSCQRTVDCEESLFCPEIRGEERKISERVRATVSVT